MSDKNIFDEIKTFFKDSKQFIIGCEKPDKKGKKSYITLK